MFKDVISNELFDLLEALKSKHPSLSENVDYIVLGEERNRVLGVSKYVYEVSGLLDYIYLEVIKS